MIEHYLFTAVDYDGEGDPTGTLCKGVEGVGKAHNALWVKQCKNGESRDVTVYALDLFTGRTVKLDVAEEGEPIECKDGSLDQVYRLTDSQGLTLHVYTARVGGADLDRVEASKGKPSNAATPGTAAYIPTGDNRDD